MIITPDVRRYVSMRFLTALAGVATVLGALLGWAIPDDVRSAWAWAVSAFVGAVVAAYVTARFMRPPQRGTARRGTLAATAQAAITVLGVAVLVDYATSRAFGEELRLSSAIALAFIITTMIYVQVSREQDAA